MLCLPVSENEYGSSPGKGIEGLEKIPKPTGTTVMTDTCMEVEATSNNVRVMKSTRDNSVQESDNKPSQHLLYRSVSIGTEQYSESDSIVNIARDVEFLDNINFDATDIDELDEYLNHDELI